MKLKLLTISCLLSIGVAHAGFNGYTNHSRANCTNNESISWDWTHDWWLWTNSEHYNVSNGELIHTLNTGAQLTWRSAAAHWGEGQIGWQVHGRHWRLYTDKKWHLESDEWITDCSIYDGWWDRNK